MKSLYDTIGMEGYTDEQIKQNMISAAEYEDFLPTEPFKSMETFQYFLYGAQDEVLAKGMSDSELNSVIVNAAAQELAE